MAWARNNAEVANLSSEARKNDADVALLSQNLNFVRLGWQLKLAWARSHGMDLSGVDPNLVGGAGGQGAGAGVQPISPVGAGTGAGGGAGPAGVASGDQPSPSAQPVSGQPPAGGAAAPTGDEAEFQRAVTALQAKADDLLNGEIMGMVPAGASNIIRNQLTEAQKAGQIFYNGKLIISPNIMRQQAEQAGKKAYGEEGGKEMNDEEADAANNLAPLQKQLERLNDAETLMGTLDNKGGFRPGAGATEIAHAQNAARRLGIDLGNPSGVYMALKNSLGASWDLVRTMKGQVRNMELQGAGAQTFSPDIPSEANMYIIDRLRGAVRQEIDYNKAFRAWRKTNEGQSALSPNPFRGDWYDEHGYDSYIQKNLAEPKEAPRGAVRPIGVPSTATRQVGEKTGKVQWIDKTTGKIWSNDGTPKN
jgi:hypothetical protein